MNPKTGEPDPPIMIEPGWRADVARWPHERWVAWRALADKILADGPADDVKQSQWLAYVEMSRCMAGGR